MTDVFSLIVCKQHPCFINMESFMNEIKRHICLDIDQKELSDIKESIVTLLGRLLKSLEHVNDRLVVKRIVSCGSMEEGTRNWKFSKHNREPIIEFDFLGLLNDPTDSRITFTEHCSGFMTVLHENEKYLHYSYNKAGNSLQGDRISFSFGYDLMKSVNFMCNCFHFDDTLQFLQKDECCKYVVQGTVTQTGEGCEICTEHKSSGYMQIATGSDVGSPYYYDCSLVFKWTSHSHSLLVPDPKNCNEKRCQDFLYILVDFLPAFEVFKQNRGVDAIKISPDDRSSDFNHECYLVPKMCKKRHQTCWKISDCEIEIQSLKNTSQNHRVAYMIMKFLCDKLFAGFVDDGSIPTTYRIKTIVLHHIQECETCEVFTCLQKLLHTMAISFSHQSLSHFVNGANLLLANAQDRLPVQNKAWHKNRCIVVSECFYFIQQLLMTENLSKTLHIGNFTVQSLIELLKCIGKAFHLAWSQTEVEPMYCVNKEKLLFFLEKLLYKLIISKEKFINLFGCETNFSSMVMKQCSQAIHWTAHLRVWEYESVREMYQSHHLECPDPPGRKASSEEIILQEAKMFCGFHSWSYEDQAKWIAKLANSRDPGDIVTALKAVDIYFVDEKTTKPGQITPESFK